MTATANASPASRKWGLSGFLLLSLVSLCGLPRAGTAEVLVEWSFENLPPDLPITEVPAAPEGAPPLQQEEAIAQPMAISVEGKEGTAALFETTRRQFLSAPADGPYDFGENEPFTVEVIAKIRSFPSATVPASTLIMKRNTENILSSPGWSINVLTDGRIAFVLATGEGRIDVTRSENTVPPEEWLHIAAVRGSDMRARLYINGELVTEKPAPFESLKNPGKFLVGRHSGAENPAFFFDGEIRRIRISGTEKTFRPGSDLVE